MSKSKNMKSKVEIHEIDLYEFNNLKIICDVKNYKPLVKKAAYALLRKIRHDISLLSDLCYRPNQITYNSQDQQFILPITVQYHNEEGDILKLLNDRVKTIKNTVSKLKFETNRAKFIARVLDQYKVDPFNFLQITYSISEVKKTESETELISESIELNLPKIPNFEIKEHFYKKGNFRHLEYIDPLLLDYGLYIGLSKPFNQMGYSYNILHIYEHMMVVCWQKLDQKDLLGINGCTFPSGNCYLYNIHRTKKSLKKFAREYVKFHQLTKTRDYWEKDLKDYLKRETVRTYSETQTSKSLKEFGRTDNTIYSEMIYNIEPFIKFSEDTYTILTVSPEPIDFKFEKYIPNIVPDTPKVSERKYDFMPLAALRNPNKFVVIDKKDLNEEIYDKNACLFGVDCVFVSLDDDAKESEIFNTILLFMLKHNINTINEFMKGKTMPIDNINFSNINVYYNSESEYEYDFDDEC